MLLTEWNMDDALDVRYEEGVEDGIEQGMERGIEQAHIDAARRMKKDGVEAAFIAKYTGLTIAEINGIS